MLTPWIMAGYRQAVLSASKALFLARGYDQVRDREIAAAAGVPVHVPGQYFGGRRALLVRVVEDLEHGLLSELARLGASDATTAQALIEKLVGLLLSQSWRDLERLHGLGPAIGRDFEVAWRSRLFQSLASLLASKAEMQVGDREEFVRRLLACCVSPGSDCVGRTAAARIATVV